MEHYKYHAPLAWRICFFSVSILALGMGLFPWFLFLTSEHFPNTMAILILSVFTALPLCLGFGLLFFSLRWVRFSFVDQRLLYTSGVWCFSRTRQLEFDLIRLKRASFGSRNPRLWLAIYGHKPDSTWMFANEQTCDSVLELFEWFSSWPQLGCEDGSKEHFGNRAE